MKDFVKLFTDHEFSDIVVINNKYFQTKFDYTEEPEHIGIYLGKKKGKKFEPSIELINMIAQHSDRKLWVNQQAEWLFLCGRDLMGKSIGKSNVHEGHVLIQNQYDENLGFGLIIGDILQEHRIVVNNVLDKGFYLRKER